MKNLSYLFAAYAVVWVVLFGYVYSLLRRTKELRQDLEDFKKGIDKAK